MGKLRALNILGLFGDRNVRLSIEGDVLVVVGQNGTGKSTAISILFLCLTAQWDRLSTHKFDSVEIEFSDRAFKFSRAEIKAYSSVSDLALHRLSRAQRELFDEDYLRLQAYRNAVAHGSEFSDELSGLTSKQLSRLAGHRRSYESYLKSSHDVAILYLPTYRRIEKELQEIFRGTERVREAERLIKRISAFTENNIELVSFGMEDVKTLISTELEDVRRIANARLNDLTGRYLRDIVDRHATEFSLTSIAGLSQDEISNALKIVDVNSLPEPAKAAIQSTILALISGKKPDIFDQLLANYFSKLYTTYQQIRAREARVNLFVEICNSYFYGGKEFSYDEPTHELKLHGSGDSALDLSSLSSGEKQIVSIFAHILLSTKEKFFVIIDEPEMSLSVRWQETFLPDMMRTERIGMMVAVTHSPFIFQNYLTESTRDFAQFLSYAE